MRIINAFLAAAIIATLPAVSLACSLDYGIPHEELVEGHPAPFSISLNPVFVKAAKDYKVPVELLLTLAYTGSNFENRALAPTIENGYGVMALRQGAISSESVSEAAGLLGVSEYFIKTDPTGSIRGAAALLNKYGAEEHIDRSKGLDAWLPVIIRYAGLDEENSRFFASIVLQKAIQGFDYTNRAGERFVLAPQSVLTNLNDLMPMDMSLQSDDYAPAIWDPAASCNYSTSTSNKTTVVVHTIEGTAAGARSWFKNCASEVSCQYVVSEAGTVWQMVRENQRAWHVSCYNTQSIGIEHEGYAASSSHPATLYNASALLAKSICDRWGIPKVKVTSGAGVLGHVDVTNCCCGTHTDPGNGWDWNYYMNQISPSVPLDATLAGQSYTQVMEAGSTQTVWVEFNNTGSETWQKGQVNLGTWNAQDRSSAFFTSGNWLGANRPSDLDAASTATGAVGRFTFVVTAPNTPGIYNESWRLVKEGVSWFGPTSVTFNFIVNAQLRTLNGTVVDSDTNLPVSGAAVSLGSWNATTNASGVYTFNSIPSGSYTLTVTKAGYNGFSALVSVAGAPVVTKYVSIVPLDLTNPSTPTGLSANGVSSSQIDLAWNASTDNVAVQDYIIFRNGIQIGITTLTTASDSGLNAATTYSYTVRSRDTSGNLSAESEPAVTNTQAGTVAIFEDGIVDAGFWSPLIQSPFSTTNAAVVDTAKSHAVFEGTNTLRTVFSPTTGSLTGHSFPTAFNQATFEGWFFDGAGSYFAYNQQFSTTMDGWQAYPNSFANLESTIDGQSGSAAVATDGGWTGGMYKEITSGFTAGDPYTLNLWTRWPSGATYGTPPRAFVRYFNASGTELNTDYSTNITTNGSWQQVTLEGSIPANTTKLWIGVWGSRSLSETYSYSVDQVSFVAANNIGSAVSNNSRQGLQIRSVDANGVVKAEVFVGPYSISGPTGSAGKYSVGYLKGASWTWQYNLASRTSGWHKFTIEALPYTGTGDIKVYIDGQLVSTLNRTADTHTYGFREVAFGFHYPVNQESWFDDLAMYAKQPDPAPAMQAPLVQGENSIRWSFIDNSNNEAGFRLVDQGGVSKGTAAALAGTGVIGFVDEAGLQPNTSYSRTVKAYNGSLDSFTPSAVSAWTMAKAPSMQTVTCDKPTGVYQSQNDFTFTAVGGFGQGSVSFYRYAWNKLPAYGFNGGESDWSAGNLTLNAASAGDWYLHLKSYNGANVGGGEATLGPYKYAGQLPTQPVVSDGGPYTPVVNKLNATWTPSSSEIGIETYEAAVGTAVDDYSVLNWSPVGNVTDTVINLPADMTAGVTYFIHIRAKDMAGNYSAEGISDGITALTATERIGLAKQLPDGQPVALKGKLVSGVFNFGSYIQEPDRSSGLKLDASDGVIGNEVSVAGVLTTESHERVLSDTCIVINQAAGVHPPTALRISSPTLGGQGFGLFVPGITSGIGLNNIGLLVEASGWIASNDGFTFVVNDGGPSGIKVPGGGFDISSFTAADLVSVRGIVGITNEGGILKPVIRIRSASDITKKN